MTHRHEWQSRPWSYERGAPVRGCRYCRKTKVARSVRDVGRRGVLRLSFELPLEENAPLTFRIEEPDYRKPQHLARLSKWTSHSSGLVSSAPDGDKRFPRVVAEVITKHLEYQIREWQRRKKALTKRAPRPA